MRLFHTFAVLCTLVHPASLCIADNWPQFRGPTGDGHSSATDLPLHYSEQENVRWKTAIDGKGWSSPVIWENQIWLTTAPEDGKKLHAICVDRESGEILRDIVVFEVAEPQYCHPMNSYATPTPVVEEGRVYVHFGAHGTACLDTATGKTLWSRTDLECNHFRGPASSPIVDRERLYVHFDGFDLQYVVALDKQTGKTVWRTDRGDIYPTDNGDRKKAYGTPALIEFGGRRQLISPGAEATMSYDPASGQQLWIVHHGGMNVSARPLFGHGLAYINTGGGGLSLLAVEPAGSGDISDSHVRWTQRQNVPKRSSQLLIDGLIYMVADNGVVSCLDARTGELAWSRPQRIDGEYAASPIFADGKIWFFSREGKITVIAPGRQFKVLAENQLDDGFMASPAALGQALYLRSTTHLYRIEKQ